MLEMKSEKVASQGLITEENDPETAQITICLAKRKEIQPMASAQAAESSMVGSSINAIQPASNNKIKEIAQIIETDN